jgi:hypothetical protein
LKNGRYWFFQKVRIDITTGEVFKPGSTMLDYYKKGGIPVTNEPEEMQIMAKARFLQDFKPDLSKNPGTGFTLLDLELASNTAVYYLENDPHTLRFAFANSLYPTGTIIEAEEIVHERELETEQRRKAEIFQAKKQMIKEVMDNALDPYFKDSFQLLGTGYFSTYQTAQILSPTLLPENEYILFALTMDEARDMSVKVKLKNLNKDTQLLFLGHNAGKDVKQLYFREDSFIGLRWTFPNKTSNSTFESNMWLTTEAGGQTIEYASFVILSRPWKGKEITPPPATPTTYDTLKAAHAFQDKLYRELKNRLKNDPKVNIIYDSETTSVVKVSMIISHEKMIWLTEGKHYKAAIVVPDYSISAYLKWCKGDECPIKGRLYNQIMEIESGEILSTGAYTFHYSIAARRSYIPVYVIIYEVIK